MRLNEYNSLEEFTSQYIGEWNPSEEHWLGLEFSYNGNIYRFNTGSMYNENDTILPDGRIALFGLYLKNKSEPNFTLLGEYACMEDVLNSRVIDGVKFKSVIMDECTELLGQD